MRRIKLFFVISLSFIVMFMMFSNSFSFHNDLKAETAVIDDGPLGEKIVDIAASTGGQSYFALTENGEIYAWGDNSNAQLGTEDSSTYVNIPKRVLNSSDGNEYLRDVKAIYGTGDQGIFSSPRVRGYTIALTNDNTLYGWGTNENGVINPDKLPKGRPEKINIDFIPKEVSCGSHALAVLDVNGIVHVLGSSSNGGLGLGEDMSSVSEMTPILSDNDNQPLPKIIDIATSGDSIFLLGEDGFIYASGISSATGTGVTSFHPMKAKLADQSYVKNITDLYDCGSGYTMMARDNTGMIFSNKTETYLPFFAPLSNFVSYHGYSDPDNILPDSIYINREFSGLVVLSKDNILYTGSQSYSNGFYYASASDTLRKYSRGDIPINYQGTEKAIYAQARDKMYLLSKRGGVYLDGKKISFGEITLKGSKQDGTGYSSEEKFNDEVYITMTTNEEIIIKSDVVVRETNLLNGDIKDNLSANDILPVTVKENERVKVKYDYYVKNQESRYKASFTVDLYKKTPVVSDISKNGKYPRNKVITLGYNGFLENTISATISKDGGEVIEYISGTALVEVGNYVLNIKDQYGNTNSYSFEITDKPVAESITFTKNPSGELTYANSITKVGNQLGTISLVYPAGTSSSTIASASVKDEGDGVNFEIKNNNQLYVKTSDLTAKEYTISITGTDANGMPFSGDVTITIAKATQTMAWDETSAKLSTDGISLGDEITLGVKDVLGNASITYGLKTPNSCITMTANKVKVTCIPSPASVTFTAIPSGNDNYTSDPIELTASISKKAVSLKTVIQDSDGTYKDSASVKVGAGAPNVKVVDSEGNEVTELGNASIVFKKNGTTFADPTIESGTYTVEATYPSDSAADNYTITWASQATLVVRDIVIDENNASDYYTLTSDGKPYTPDTWTNQAIIITPVHTEFNLMSVENANASSSPYTYNVEGSKEVKLTFSTADGAKASTKVKLKYDKTNPVLTSFQYDDVSSPVRSLLNSLFSFTHYFDKEKAVRFLGSDEATGSGVKEYTYEVIELNSDGTEIANTKKTGKLDSVNTIKLEMDKNYKITAKVIDNAGNESDPLSETVQLNDEIGELNLTAMSDGKAYDGSKWTSKAIDITLTGTNKSGVKKYQYSIDGSTFIDFTSSDGTITLPTPLTSIDNKTYTFRAVNNDGTTNDKTLIMKVDKEAPIIKVKGMIGGNLYDGGEVDTDVTIVPYQENESLSDITYYYTKEASSKNSDPLTDTNWKKYSGLLSETSNGTHTYYCKGINGAGVQSDPVDITIKIAKKEYTKVNVSVTSENQSYTSGTWAKHDITFTLSGGLSDESIITGYEYTITKDGSRPASTATWNRVSDDKQHIVTENSEHETYWFRVLPVDPNGSISKGTLINLDVEKPSKPTFTMEEIHTNPVARFVNALSFGQWMKAGVKVTIESNDTISGLDHYTYKEISTDGSSEKRSQNGILYYEEDANIKLQAIAYDKAGNASQSSEESGSILIDTTPPVIEGVKDKDVYKKYYYVYRTITYHDGGSGIDEDSAVIKKDGVADTLVQGYKVKDVGSYEVSVQDIAGNEAIVRFQLVPLPNIDTEIDGSDESREIIDQVQKELEEERENLSPDEIKDFEKWIEDAEKKWESERKKKLEDKETGTIVEGEGNTSFDPNTELIVDKIDETKIPELPRKAIHVYDVYMKKGDTVIQPDGSVKVYLPYNEEEEPIIYEIDEQGNVKEIKGTKENGYVSFITDTLEKYAISNTAQDETKKDVCVVGPDNNLDTSDDVCGSDDSTKNPDGSVDVPAGGKVIFPDKEIDAPDGAHINPDGSVDFPDGSHYDPDGNLKPKEEEKNTCTAGPDGKLGTKDDVCGEGNGKDDPTKNEDGSVDVPNGGTIHFPDKEIDAPDGAHINPDGSVVLPDGTEYDKDGNKKPKVCELHDGETLNVDTDKDGLPDINLDIDNNCIADLNIDIDGDNIPDLNIDSKLDGKADINIDKNGDGFADINIVKLSKWVPDKNVTIDGFSYDTMSNLLPDMNIDTDGDGKPDVNVDSDGDGVPDKNLDGKWQNQQMQNSGGALANSANTGDQTKWLVWWIVAFVTTITMVYQVYSYRKSR